jgi:hypothetical protein
MMSVEAAATPGTMTRIGRSGHAAMAVAWSHNPVMQNSNRVMGVMRACYTTRHAFSATVAA